MDVSEVVIRPLADAFLQVGVFVALLAGVTAWARVHYGERLLDVMVDHPRWAVPCAALLGVSPGCAGTILVVVLAAQRRASYGCAVAALTATMGDSSFVILGARPEVGLAIHAVLLVTGLLTGYAVDTLHVDPRGSRSSVPAAAPAPEPIPVRSASAVAVVPWDEPRRRPVLVQTIVTGAVALPVGPAVVCLLAVLGTALVVPATLSLPVPTTVVPGWPELDPWLAVGAAGTVACLYVFLRSGCRFSDDDQPPMDARGGLAHAGEETAFVVVWVGAAMLAQSLLVSWTGFDGSQLPLHGLTGVVVAALVGLVPGCGTQIAFTGLFVAGAMPLPTLLTNAVAQDGDGLLPMLALDRRAALVTTGLTTFPALLVGCGALVILSGGL
jgi:hypothetical protein